MRFVLTHHRFDERGEGKGQLILTLSVVAIIAYALIKFVPAYYNKQDFVHEVEELARTATIRGEKDDKIRARFEKIANEHSLDPTTTTFDIARKGGTLVLTVDCTIPVVLPGYTYELGGKMQFTEAGLGKY